MQPLHFVQSQTFLKARLIVTSFQSVSPVQCTPLPSIPIALFYFIYLLFKELSLSFLINWFMCISYVYQFMCTICPWRFELPVSCSVNVRYCWVKSAHLDNVSLHRKSATQVSQLQTEEEKGQGIHSFHPFAGVWDRKSVLTGRETKHLGSWMQFFVAYVWTIILSPYVLRVILSWPTFCYGSLFININKNHGTRPSCLRWKVYTY